MKKMSLILIASTICIFAASTLFATNLPGKAPDPTKPDAKYEWVDEGKDEITGYQQKWEPDTGKNKCECPKGSRDPNCGQMVDDLDNPIYTWVPNMVYKQVSPKCIKIQIGFGHAVHNSRFSNGNIYIIKEKPSPTIFSPQGLSYSVNMNSYIYSVETDEEDLPVGVTREVNLRRSNGYELIYSFKTGESEGIPTGASANFLSRLIMLDGNLNPVTTDPSYYERRFSNGDAIRYSAETRQVIERISSSGEVVAMADKSIGIEVLEDSNILRQVWSAADGLADIVVIDEYKYEIRLYAPENAGEKDAVTGFYVPTGTPFEVWTIENPQRSDTDIDKAKVTKTANGNSYVYDWEYLEATDEWIVTSGGGLSVSSKAISWNDNKTEKTVTYETRGLNGAVVSKKIEYLHVYPWGEDIYKTVIDPDGDAYTIDKTYYDNSAETGKYSKVKTEQNSSGYWRWYDYDSVGRKTVMVEPFKDSPLGSAAEDAKATYYSYQSHDPLDVPADNDSRPRTIEEKFLGITKGKVFFVYKKESGSLVSITESAAPSASYGDSANKRKVETYYPESSESAEAGRLKSFLYPDGRKDSFFYEYGTYTSSPTPASCSFAPDQNGYAFRKTVIHGTELQPDGIAYKTTKDVEVFDQYGNRTLVESYIYTGTAYERISWTVNVYDSEHHILHSYNSNNTETEATWNCCSKASEITPSGEEYTYAYDLLQRLALKTKKGYNGTVDLNTSYTYDATGRELSRTTSGGSLSLATAQEYNLMGHPSRTTDVSGLETTYSYQNGGRITTVTLPGGTTQVTEKYLDGKLKSITGTAVVAKYYDYGVNADGTQWTKESIASASSPRWTQITTDYLDRVIKQESPGYTGTVITQNYYNDKGQLVKAEKTGMADTLYEYDSLGNQIRSGLDISGNGSLDLASMDRINETETVASLESTDWWNVTTDKVYATDNSATATTVSTGKTRLTGFSGIVAESKSIDIHNNVTTSTTAINRTIKTVTQTTDTPDSSTNVVSISVNGLLTSSQTSQNLVYTYAYDDIGRRTTVTDPRTGAVTTAYYTAGTGKIGKVYTVTDAASNVTSYDYDSSTGRLTLVENALNKKSYYAYNDHGQLTRQWGDTGYPIENVYDSYGQLAQLKTYRAGSGWNNATWPGTTGDADTTTWTYQVSTGLLTAKTDADSKSATYTYTQDGKLYTRTWSRLDGGNALTTTYSYDANTAEMTGIDYSDSTQDIAFTYNRLGKQKTVADAVGTRTFAYNTSLQLDTETITGLYSKVITRDYETTGMIGRNKGFHIGAEYDVDYGYDQYGRFNSVTNGSDTFTYGYLTNSNLVSTLTVGDISVNNTYETNRNLITSVENKYSATTVSKYDYVNDAIGRRTSMAKSGTAFTQSDTISYGYNDRSEVTSATATNDTTYNFGFAFDNIGNRSTYTTNETGSAVTSAYTSNNLNQYTAITNPTNNPTYDNDGNMLTNGDWTYTWNGENRLISAVNGTTTLEFKYDYMGRRIEKKLTENSTITKHEYFVYDGYELIEVLNALDSNSVKQKFTWGNGLACVVDGSNTYYYLCDDNQNVTQLLDSSGSIVAKYEYSPFGKQVVASGSYDNPFRFSTEYYDSETGLVYYNYRYYSAELGRWLSRDPIEEEGGWNLYGMVGNNTINEWDYLGHLTAAQEQMSRNAQKVIHHQAKISEDWRAKKHPENKDPKDLGKKMKENLGLIKKKKKFKPKKEKRLYAECTPGKRYYYYPAEISCWCKKNNTFVHGYYTWKEYICKKVTYQESFWNEGRTYLEFQGRDNNCPEGYTPNY